MMPDECAANMNGHRCGPHGRRGESQCEWCGESEPVVRGNSRNTREGRYAGRNDGRSVRGLTIEDTVWEGDQVLFTVPIPSSGAAWGVQFSRLTIVRGAPYTLVARTRGPK